MASQHHSQPHSATSSQAGLAALRAQVTAAPTPHAIIALLDAYAKASAERERMRDATAVAFLDAHRAMLAARDSVAVALGIAPAALPPLTDETPARRDALTGGAE